MTITSQIRKEIKNGNGSTVAFTFSFDINKAADITVIKTDTSNVETTITEGTGTTNFSIAVSSYPGTGTITYPATLGTELATGEQLTLLGVVDIDQDTDLINQAAWNPKQVEDALDYGRMVDLQQQNELDRTIKLPVSFDETTMDMTLPEPVANGYFVWSSDGLSITTTSSSETQWLGGDGTVSLPYFSFSSDPDSGMYRVGANSIALGVSGAIVLGITATGLAVTGDLTTTGAVEPAGDTASGDNAAIGYTATEGLILTGQGSTNDVTVKNDADADVLVVPTGTTNVDIVGVATAATFEPDGDTASSDNAAIGYTATEGLILTGQGSANDVTIKNDADAEVLSVPTGTQNLTAAGDLTIAGDLTVNGTTATLDVTNQVIADNLIELNNGATSNANDSGIVIERGSTGDNAIIVWDESADVWTMGTTTATGASTGNLTVTAGGLTVGNITGAAITLGSGGQVTGIADEDDMSSDSSTLLTTQQAVKAYIDAEIASNSKAAGIQMTWEANTNDADQGVGKVWANNATLSSATVLYFDDVENNSVSINALIDSLDDPTTANSAMIYIQEAGTASAGVVFKVSGAVTSASTYSKVAVTHVATIGTLADADVVGVVFALSGDDPSDPPTFSDLTVTGSLITGADEKSVAIGGGALSSNLDGSSPTFTTLQIGGNGFLWGNIAAGASKSLYLTQNATFNGTNEVYTSTDTATQMQMVDDEINLRAAVSGTAGNAITWIDITSFDLGSGTTPTTYMGALHAGPADKDFTTHGTFVNFTGGGLSVATNNGETNQPIRTNIEGGDSDVMVFFGEGTEEGYIGLSGTTVSYNTFTGAHDAQWGAAAAPCAALPKGTLLSTVDEQYERYVDELPERQVRLEGQKDAEGNQLYKAVCDKRPVNLGDPVPEGATRIEKPKPQLSKVKVTSSAGDKRVYGVFEGMRARTDEETQQRVTTDVIQVFALGTAMVRVTGPIKGGDLIQSSNTPGVAERQPDDIVRSKTVGKVSRGDSETRERLVACVLYSG
jgi:hypothetical protein